MSMRSQRNIPQSGCDK